MAADEAAEPRCCYYDIASANNAGMAVDRARLLQLEILVRPIRMCTDETYSILDLLF
jgi:hypothetical protein